MQLKKLKKYGEVACVLGGTEGIGRAYTDSLISAGFKVICVSNAPETFEEVTNTHGQNVIPFTLDLGTQDAWKTIETEIILAHKCSLLIYNAAASPVQRFTKTDIGALEAVINVNCRTLLLTCHSFLNARRSQGPCALIMVTSMAGLFGTQLVATYAASKAFITNLAEGLYEEHRDDKNVDILGVICGTVDTPGLRKSEPLITSLTKPMTPQQVVRGTWRRLGKDALAVPGRSNSFTVGFLTHILPRRVARRLVNDAIKNMYPDRAGQ